MTGSSHDEIVELLGAYALDAVDDDEAAVVAAHMTECPRCAAEVQDYQELAGCLANSGGDAPGRLWDRIAAQIEQPGDGDGQRMVTVFSSLQGEKKQKESPGGRQGTGSGTHAFRPWLTGVAAAVVVVIAALGFQVGRLDHRVGQLQAASQQQGLTQAAESALADPRARRVTLTAAHSTGPEVAEIVILPSGAAFVVDNRLPALTSDQTYQLWGQIGDQLVSLGLLGNQPKDVPFHVDPTAAISAFAVTAERAGELFRRLTCRWQRAPP